MSTRGTNGDSWALEPLSTALDRAADAEKDGFQRWVVPSRPSGPVTVVVAPEESEWSSIKLCRSIEGDGLVLADVDPCREAELTRLLLGEPHGEA